MLNKYSTGMVTDVSRGTAVSLQEGVTDASSKDEGINCHRGTALPEDPAMSVGGSFLPF